MREFFNNDCMDIMKQYPDDYFDLAIVDPPYFSGPEKREYYGRKVSPIGVSRLYGETSEWQIPNRDYFDELFRVSKNQIIERMEDHQWAFSAITHPRFQKHIGRRTTRFDYGAKDCYYLATFSGG